MSLALDMPLPPQSRFHKRWNVCLECARIAIELEQGIAPRTLPRFIITARSRTTEQRRAAEWEEATTIQERIHLAPATD